MNQTLNDLIRLRSNGTRRINDIPGLGQGRYKKGIDVNGLSKAKRQEIEAIKEKKTYPEDGGDLWE